MNKYFKIISVVLSVVISVILVFTSVSAIILTTTREYFVSRKFNTQIENTDLASLKFIYDGKKITFKNYVKEYVNTNIDNHILDKASPYYSDLWFPFADALTDYTVDKVFSSEYVNKLVKDEFKEIINYFLHSSVDEAKQRIEEGITLELNEQLNPDNAKDYEDKISAEVKLAVLKSIEEETGTSCDKIIVMMSEKTASSLKSISIILGILLLLLNIKNIVNTLVYLGIAFCGCGGVITYIQNNFEDYFEGAKDLITYEFLNPVVNEYTPYAEKGIVYGIICIAIFVTLTVALKFLKKDKSKL